MRRALVLGALLATLAAAPARAHMDYPGLRPATDPMARWTASVIGLGYWRARGLTACPNGVQTFYADSLTDTDGIAAAGRGGDCEAALLASYMRELRPRNANRLERRYLAEDECRTWTHEVGHALGLPHTSDGGVMDPDAVSIPTECRRWARAVVPVRTKRARRGNAA